MLFGLFRITAQDNHKLYFLTQSGSLLVPKTEWGIKSRFLNDSSARDYLTQVFTANMQKAGYLALSIDSIYTNRDTTFASIYLGQQYNWGIVQKDSLIDAIVSSDKISHNFSPGTKLSPASLNAFRAMLLRQFEDSGYPFARFRFDSGFFDNDSWYARIRVDPGPFYRIERIVNDGKLKVSPHFLEQYLNLKSGDMFSRTKLEDISKKLSRLGYLKEAREWDLTLLGTGAILNLHLDPERSSRFNLLAGLMPSNQQVGGKLLLTGEANLELDHVFNAGESLSVQWQQIQVQSPRLQVFFEKPYLLKTPIGMDFRFNLLKKDSSFLTLDTRLGMINKLNENNKVSLFLQRYSSVLINPDTGLVKLQKKLPRFLDVQTTLFGVAVTSDGLKKTGEIAKGFRLQFDLTGGLRRVIRNADIVALEKDADGQKFDFSSLYDSLVKRSAQFKFMTRAERFWPIGRLGAFKTGIFSGWMFAKGILLNEVYQIGGFKSLRGFDEESIYVSGFAVGTIEYRYPLAKSSFIYSFADLAYLERKIKIDSWRGVYTGLGLGLAFETRAGQFNLAYAAGKRDNQPINLREAKIHFGIISSF